MQKYPVPGIKVHVMFINMRTIISVEGYPCNTEQVAYIRILTSVLYFI